MSNIVRAAVCAAVVVAAIMGVLSFADEESEAYVFELDDYELKYGFYQGRDDAVITGFNSLEGFDGDVVIPSEITHTDGTVREVLEINKDSFKNNKEIKSVTISEGVTTIGESAFYGSSLVSVEIPDSVTTIGQYAFFNTDLQSVEIPGSVKVISSYAFQSCTSLDSVVIQDGVESIGDYAFNELSADVVIIPDSVVHIGTNAFGDRIGQILIIVGDGYSTSGNTVPFGNYSEPLFTKSFPEPF